MKDITLLDEIADMENLESAFFSCLQGKRAELSPQMAFLKLDSYLEWLRILLLRGVEYPWGQYREFYVSDPKRRLVSSAPFMDRVAHRAIYNIINPLLDGRLIDNTYACREGKGNGRAVIKLIELLRAVPNAYVVKMDVKKYFASVHHGRLLGKVLGYLPDDSCAGLFKSLLKSHPDYRHGVGLPLGNLTSQIFANFYLHNLDDFLMEKLEGRYVRYMDDFVMVCKTKEEALKVRAEVVRMSKIEKLKFPVRKRVWIENGEVPFLGFLVSADGAKPLNRNKRRVARKTRHKMRIGMLPSEIAKGLMSYEAWKTYPERVDKK